MVAPKSLFRFMSVVCSVFCFCLFVGGETGIAQESGIVPPKGLRIEGGVRIIENHTFTSTVDIDGEVWNGAIIRNNTFTCKDGFGLHISNVRDLTIEGNRFENIERNAIKLRSENNAGTSGILIRNNVFRDINHTAILAAEQNTGLRIIGNTFTNVAKVTSGEKQHAMYLKGPGFLVEGNTIDGVVDATGISIRTSGTVRGNIVRNATEDGIKYYSNSDTKGDGLVVIEGNVVYNNKHGGISMDNGIGPLVDRIVVRFNTLVNNTNGIIVDDGMAPVDIRIYGNLIEENSGSNYLMLEVTPSLLQGNLTTSTDPGFVDMAQYDFRLRTDSKAVGFVKEAGDVPPYDFLKQPYAAPPYEAGAIQLPGA